MCGPRALRGLLAAGLPRGGAEGAASGDDRNVLVDIFVRADRSCRSHIPRGGSYRRNIDGSPVCVAPRNQAEAGSGDLQFVGGFDRGLRGMSCSARVRLDDGFGPAHSGGGSLLHHQHVPGRRNSGKVEHRNFRTVWSEWFRLALTYYLSGVVVAGITLAVNRHFGWMFSLLALPLMYLEYLCYRLKIAGERTSER